jgi:hypothetical protein
MGKSPPPFFGDDAQVFMAIASLSTAKTIFWKPSGLLMSLRSSDSEGRSEVTLTALSKYMPGDGNRLSDLVAAVSELRHSRPSQRRAPASCYRMSE